jgi:hypothetical protein
MGRDWEIWRRNSLVLTGKPCVLFFFCQFVLAMGGINSFDPIQTAVEVLDDEGLFDEEDNEEDGGAFAMYVFHLIMSFYFH